ncbi:MAG: hypothetical protein F6K47_05275 [Symploca sp. SIO2E6]|nr:hypothetical protein [Symploca sp. SIO2E6]
MNISITFKGETNQETSSELITLADLISEECGVSVGQEKQKPDPGVKDSGLTISLAIAGLALTAAQTAISAAQYWQSKRPQYVLSIYSEAGVYTLDNANREEVDRIIKIISSLPESNTQNIEIEIYRK